MEIIRIIEMPNAVRGATLCDEDGNYNIYINSKLSYEEQLKTYRHERAHIKLNHWGRNLTPAECEVEVHAIL